VKSFLKVALSATALFLILAMPSLAATINYTITFTTLLGTPPTSGSFTFGCSAGRRDPAHLAFNVSRIVP
jgi:hypothetical protein